MYNMAAHVWNEVRKSLEHAVARCNCSNNRVWATFWAAHQRFFKQLWFVPLLNQIIMMFMFELYCLCCLVSMGVKVPHIVEMAKQALADGHCVVIGLQSTGEASLDVEMTSSQPTKQRQTLMTSLVSKAKTASSDDVSGDGFVSICREILRRFLQQHFPTRIEQPPVRRGYIVALSTRITAQSLYNLATSRNLQQLKKPPSDDEWSVTAKQMLLGFVSKIKLPNRCVSQVFEARDVIVTSVGLQSAR